VSISADQLAFTLDALRPGPIRRESRTDTVRIVEYTRFPRVGPDRGTRVGFTRDLSATGMCIGTDEPESVGALLRVAIRDLDGRPSPPCIERVMWCSRARDERHWVGLERLTDRNSR
jgi:hypothetical protein